MASPPPGRTAGPGRGEVGGRSSSRSPDAVIAAIAPMRPRRCPRGPPSASPASPSPSQSDRRPRRRACIAGPAALWTGECKRMRNDTGHSPRHPATRPRGACRRRRPQPPPSAPRPEARAPAGAGPQFQPERKGARTMSNTGGKRAWEFLRRNPGYIEAESRAPQAAAEAAPFPMRAQTGADLEAAAWGLLAWEDPLVGGRPGPRRSGRRRRCWRRSQSPSPSACGAGGGAGLAGFGAASRRRAGGGEGGARRGGAAAAGGRRGGVRPGGRHPRGDGSGPAVSRAHAPGRRPVAGGGGRFQKSRRRISDGGAARGARQPARRPQPAPDRGRTLRRRAGGEGVVL